MTIKNKYIYSYDFISLDKYELISESDLNTYKIVETTDPGFLGTIVHVTPKLCTVLTYDQYKKLKTLHLLGVNLREAFLKFNLVLDNKDD